MSEPVVPVSPTRRSTPGDLPAKPSVPRAAGFTLIEVLIVVAIVGILAAIAYPSYVDHVQKTRRTDAHLSLLAARQAMERCRSTSYTYVGCSIDALSTEGQYDLALVDRTATAFTITATARSAGRQAGDDDCQVLSIDHLDQTGGADKDGTASDTCWN